MTEVHETIALPRNGLVFVEPIILEAGGEVRYPSLHYDKSLLVPVSLPLGWSVRTIEYSPGWWSELIDDQNRLRATIYINHAKYATEACIRPSCRLSVVTDKSEYPDSVVIQAVDGGDRNDDGKRAILFEAKMESSLDDYAKDFQASQALAFKFLDRKYPNWLSPLAHWALPSPLEKNSRYAE